MSNYKVILDNNAEMIISEIILFKIPLIKKMFDENKIGENQTIELNYINSTTFSHIVTILKFTEINPEEKQFVNNFINNMNLLTLTDFIIASNHLKIDDLKMLAEQKFRKIFEKSVQEIRAEFNLEDDFNDKEKEKNDKLYNWEDISCEEVNPIEKNRSVKRRKKF